MAYRIGHLIARLCFRGIYFLQMGRRAWLKVIVQNRRTIFSLMNEAFGAWREARKSKPDFIRAGLERTGIHDSTDPTS